MVRVAGVAVAGDLCENLRPAADRVLILFQNQHSCTLSHHETAATAVERQAGLQRVLGCGEGLDVGEAAKAQGSDSRLGAACDNGVGQAELDCPESLADCVSAGRAGRDDGQAGALSIEAYGDISCAYVADQHGDEVRGDAGYALVDHYAGLLDEGLHSSDARTHIDSEAVGLDVDAGLEPALRHGLDGRAGGELAELVAATDAGGVHSECDGIEIGHPAGHVDREFSELVHSFDEGDAAAARCQAAPICIYIVADGRDDAHSGYDYSSFFHCQNDLGLQR